MQTDMLTRQWLGRLFLIAALLPCGAAATVQADPPPSPALTAEQIVARNVAARGGLEAWRRIQNMVWTGRMIGTSADQPVMQFVLDQARPNKTRFEVTVMGQKSVRVFDGFNGWKLRPGHGMSTETEPFTLKEVRFAQEEEVIDGPLIDAAARGSQVSLSGLEEVAGHPAWRLEVTRASGIHATVWVDAETFLELRHDRISYNFAGKPVPVTTWYRNYHEVQGLQMPAMIDIGGSYDRPANRMVIEQIELNTDLDPRTFGVTGSTRHHAKWNPGTQRSRVGASLLTPPPPPTAASTAAAPSMSEPPEMSAAPSMSAPPPSPAGPQ